MPANTGSIWKRLYGLTWLVVVEFLLALAPGGGQTRAWIHAGLGVAIAALAWWSYRGLKATAVPGRVKRTSMATVGHVFVAGGLGVLVFQGVGADVGLFGGYTLYHALLFVHIFLAVAILAQAAATGIGYDMWQEKEFEQPSQPGEIPPPPQMSKGARD
ncbi:MAG: hypothetical protein R3185_01190 [Candidatus Thermoplasmatota archaeon]|nr:hypothetical protein [Candidatus Thermoplasmatota archaeon]